jgi:hypothetical protein
MCAASSSMDLGCLDASPCLQTALRLCVRYLDPADVCMLKCSCFGLRDLRVSWQDHSINFKLGKSCSTIVWLLENIVTMRRLSLEVNLNVP